MEVGYMLGKGGRAVELLNTGILLEGEWSEVEDGGEGLGGLVWVEESNTGKEEERGNEGVKEVAS